MGAGGEAGGEAGELETLTWTGADSDATVDLVQATCYTGTKVQILTRGGFFFL